MQSIFSKLFIASDHAGYPLKTELFTALKEQNLIIEDLGCFSEESTDYPTYAKKVAKMIATEENSGGILICSTGIGMSIMANRFSYIRAALCGDRDTAILSRQHNNANVLVLARKQLDVTQASDITKLWLTTPFEGGRHARRVHMLQEV